MTAQAPAYREHGNAYNIFILVLTIYSLALMVLLLLPIDPQTRVLVNFYDNVSRGVFLIDFTMNLLGSKPKRSYFVTRRGWPALLGSVPSFGFSRTSALPRTAR